MRQTVSRAAGLEAPPPSLIFARMLLTLVADPHIAASPADTHGVDTKANYNRVVQRVRELRPDRVVLLGDYSDRHPRRADVEWVCSRMRLAEVPFDVIVGNHDSGRHVAEVCGPRSGLIGERLYFRRDLDGLRALFLDTSTGRLDQEQLDWLQLNVSGARGPLLVFMHHPPVHAGVPYMDDNHALRDLAGELHNVLFSGVKPVHVFCGHYHNARTVCLGPHSVHLCPSTYFQLDASKDDFATSGHSMPGVRHVEVEGERVTTWVEFLPG